jgi:hypothetical protein
VPAVTWIQKYDEVDTASLDQPEADLVFIASGSENVNDIWAAAILNLGSFGEVNSLYGGLWLQNFKTTHLGAGFWRVDAHYGKTRPIPVDNLQFTAETTGGTIHREVSLSTANKYSAAGVNLGDIPDFGGLINVTRDGVQGVDLPGPKFSFTVERLYDSTTLPGDYLSNLAKMTPSINTNNMVIVWKNQVFNLDVGEVRYDGGAISDGGLDPSVPSTGHEMIRVSHKFEVSRNDNNLTFGTFATPINKNGWQYAWALTRDTVSNGYRSKQIVGVYVENVFYGYDFTQLRLDPIANP